LFLQKDEVYLNLVLEYVPETVYRVARNCSKSKQTLPPLLIKVILAETLLVLVLHLVLHVVVIAKINYWYSFVISSVH